MTENLRPLLYSEWRRQQPEATRAGYNAYLREQGFSGDPVTAVIVDKLYGDPDPGRLARLIAEQDAAESERTYTKAEVNAALNRAANLVEEPVGDEYSGTILLNTGLNLAVSATSYLLDHPNATLDEIIIADYSDSDIDLNDDDGDFDDLGEDEPVPEKGSPAWNAALVRKVKGWLA